MFRVPPFALISRACAHNRRFGKGGARGLYDKARACASVFQSHELVLAALPETPTWKLLSPALPEDIAKAIPFDGGKAKDLCGELEAAIDQFIEAVIGRHLLSVAAA